MYAQINWAFLSPRESALRLGCSCMGINGSSWATGFHSHGDDHFQVERSERKTVKVQWMNLLRNSSFINRTQFPLLCEKSGAF